MLTIVIFVYVLYLPRVVKWAIVVVLIIGTPALGDLWESYDDYLEHVAKTRPPKTEARTKSDLDLPER